MHAVCNIKQVTVPWYETVFQVTTSVGTKPCALKRKSSCVREPNLLSLLYPSFHIASNLMCPWRTLLQFGGRKLEIAEAPSVKTSIVTSLMCLYIVSTVYNFKWPQLGRTTAIIRHSYFAMMISLTPARAASASSGSATAQDQKAAAHHHTQVTHVIYLKTVLILIRPKARCSLNIDYLMMCMGTNKWQWFVVVRWVLLHSCIKLYITHWLHSV